MISNLKFTLSSFSRDDVFSHLKIYYNIDELELRTLLLIHVYKALKGSRDSFSKKDLFLVAKKYANHKYGDQRHLLHGITKLIDSGFVEFAFVEVVANRYITTQKYEDFLIMYQAFISKETRHWVRRMFDPKIPAKIIHEAKKAAQQHIKKLERLKKKK